MAGPRFLYMSQGSSDRRFGWRLIGANNRPLAFGWDDQDSLAECEAAVELLRASVHIGITNQVADVTSGLWAWRFEVAGQRLAVSTRSYYRQRECAYNAAAFVAAVPLATSVTSVLVLPQRGHIGTGRAALSC